SSRHESGPLVVQEAAVVGVPTVGTSVGHLVEWAPDAAVTVPVADPMALARGVRELLDDEKRRISVARAAQARALEKDADWTARTTLEIYEEIARERR
ncbi:MAG: glycosyltransferase family 4 protein, partial [Gemmatimonadetes bacterium]|nr:glycosyltransferase family 4 protein [Gemmatimonadota bacterium]NIR78163.1 glycosyltransferase family 4 protein [Gemmatimonadota bacterium]NIT86733.1 glycosyltransferase family 4 protein [Gemmatimonadota bacterium]NIU30594.1 glycosyltransferase family 4 protein [Gemmatimonadota bacterium]NIV60960.1 glycosyltransferase [Gemmatimonadota bacterium]